MTYLPKETPLGQQTPDEAPFWAACQRRELRIQRCASCGLHRHPPGPVCPRCHSMASEWHLVPGTGTVFTYTVVHHAVHPVLKAAVPYNVAVILLDEADDVRLVSNVVDTREGLTIGQRVELVWEEVDEGRLLPRFRLLGAAGEEHHG